jgi:hypothetical protein
MAAELLWRKVLEATIDTLEGRSRGQYDIRLGRPEGIERFFAGMPRTPETPLGGYDVAVPLAAASAPVAVPETILSVAYIGPESRRADWRIPSQRPDTAYPLWRRGVGLLPGTPPGQDCVVLLRDPENRFHARWLRGTTLATLPQALVVRLEKGTAGVERLSTPEWEAVRDLFDLEIEATSAAGPAPHPAADAAGEAYRAEDEDVGAKIPDPFTVDPDVLDRGIGAHKRMQNAVAGLLEAEGVTPLSHRAHEDPPFDIAWRIPGTLYVGEVKSLTAANEEKQLRLGLGQVLRYAHQLRQDSPTVEAVLIAEREPADPTWTDLCHSLGVRLVWGPDLARLPRGTATGPARN